MQQPIQQKAEATHSVVIESENDIVTVRKAVRDAAEALGFGITDVTRIVTAASELARNVFIYAGSGTMQWQGLNTGGSIGIELKFEDNGPGIANIEQAMEGGCSTSGGLGLGLPGTKRLMDEMEINSQVGKGTIVTIRKWLKR
jgi:serine/threonine-protein kinase RsbT